MVEICKKASEIKLRSYIEESEISKNVCRCIYSDRPPQTGGIDLHLRWNDETKLSHCTFCNKPEDIHAQECWGCGKFFWGYNGDGKIYGCPECKPYMRRSS